MRFTFFVILLLTSILFVSEPLLALAHATPVNYQPQASQVLEYLPQEITIQFSEHVEPRASSIVVYAPDGKRANSDDGVVDLVDSHWYKIALRDGGKGTYTVSWQVISADDGHFTKGAYSFSVGQPSTTNGQPQTIFTIMHSSTLLESLSIGSELIGQAALLGVFVVFAYIFRPLRRREKNLEERSVYARMNILVFIGSGLVVFGSASYLVLKAYELVRFEQLAFAQAFQNFLSTSAAMVSVYRALLAILFAVIWWFTKKYITQSARYTAAEGLLLVMVVGMEFGRAVISHAAASLFHPTLSIGINFVHLVFKDLWVGGLIALVILFAPLAKTIKKPSIIGFILASFSNLSNIAIAVGGASGVYVVWLHLKDFSNLLTTDWGKGFLLLNAVAGVLIVMRLYHQFIVEPALLSEKPTNYQLQATSYLGLTLPFEMWTGIVLLLVTGMLIITTPALEAKSLFQKLATSQGLTMTLTEHPYEDNQMLVTVQDGNSNNVSLKGIDVNLTDQEKGITNLPVEVTQRFSGGYSFSQQVFSLPGKWSITIIAHPQTGYDATGTINLDYPNEILANRVDPAHPPFTFFTIVMIITAICAGLAGISLFWLSNRRRQFFLENLAQSQAEPIALYQKGSWAFALIIFGALFHIAGATTHAGHPTLLSSSFERLCTSNGHFWHESVAMKQGKVLGTTAYPGCMTGHSLQAQSHFSDEREYRYFIRPAQSIASLIMNPASPVVNTPTILTFHLTDEQGKPITELSADHERLLHTIIISQDFSTFAHIHAQDQTLLTPQLIANAAFPVSYTFPKAGKYLVAVDYTVRAQAFSETFPITVTGQPAQLPTAQIDTARQKEFSGYIVTLQSAPTTLKARSSSLLTYHIEKDGKPVTSLAPYLAAPMHFAIVRDDLVQFIHTHGLLPVSFIDSLFGVNQHQQHGILPDHFGPDIQDTITFPTPGGYEVFGEFKDNDDVVVTRFHVEIQ